MRHNWTYFERGEWCRQCGTYRTELQTDESGEKFYTYHEVASDEPRKVPEAQGQWDCPLMPRGYARAFCEWVRVAEEWGREGVVNDANVGHSALLERILAGKPVLPEPPPLAYSYPNYPLLDEGTCEPGEVWRAADRGIKVLNSYITADTLVIDQHPWRIVEALGPEEWIATYLIPDREALAKGDIEKRKGRRTERTVLSKTRWHVRCIGSRFYINAKREVIRMDEGGPFSKWWKIDRLPDAVENPVEPAGV